MVLLAENIELPARTGSVVTVKCKPSLALITADFEPVPVARMYMPPIVELSLASEVCFKLNF